jgi:hypothetical protein
MKLWRYQSKEQRKVGLDERRKGGRRRRRRKRRNSYLDTQDNILVHVVSSFFQHNIGKCRHLGTCCIFNY